MKKVYDLAVKTGTYTQNGETKGRYENIGSVMEGTDGQFMMLKRSFNPAGVPFKDGSDAILVSMFTPKDRNDRAPASQRSEAPQGHHGGGDLDSDVPFQAIGRRQALAS